MVRFENNQMRFGSPHDCLVTFIRPFSIILSSKDLPLCLSSEQISSRQYDYACLHKMVMSGNVGIDGNRLMLFCYDGALAIPKIEQFNPISRAVLFFNEKLAEALIGGFYCEAVSVEDITPGFLVQGPDELYVRIAEPNPASLTQLCFRLRVKMADEHELLRLCSFRQVLNKDLWTCMERGKRFRERFPRVSLVYVLRGVSALVRHDWVLALSSLWIAVEQAVSQLWNDTIASGKKSRTPDRDIPGRRNSLRKDTRAWSTSARLENLYQLGIISDSTHCNLAIARKARNDLSHDGQFPSQSIVEHAYRGLIDLFRVSLDLEEYSILSGLEKYINFTMADIYTMGAVPPIPIDEAASDFAHSWFYPIPSLPGEHAKPSVPDSDLGSEPST